MDSIEDENLDAEKEANLFTQELREAERQFKLLPPEEQKKILATRARFGEREAGITKAYEELEEEKRRRENEKKYW